MDEKISFLDIISGQFAFQKSLTLNQPYEYKGVAFYPVELERVIEFNACVESLKVKQERTNDKKLMKMPYLWFLVYVFENKDNYENQEFGLYIPLLFALLELVTRQNNIDFRIERNEKGDFKKCMLVLDGVEFDYKEFKEIRRIIFEQSAVEHSDEFLNADAEKAMIEGRLYEQKKSGYIPPTIENLIDILAMYLHMSVDELISTFTIRRFYNFVRYMSVFEDWKLLKGGEYSGMVTYKKPIPHWISGKSEHDIFADQNTDYKNSNLFKI